MEERELQKNREETRQSVRRMIVANELDVEIPEHSSMDEEESEDETAVLARQWHPQGTVPSYATFYRARWDARFSDVATRPKHFHCRCPTCFALQARGVRRWLTQEQRQQHMESLRAHQREYTGWRALEMRLQHSAGHTPLDLLVVAFDDTVSLSLPKFTNRAPKGVPYRKLKFVPMGITNYSSGEHFYVYMMKKKYRKGANRLLTVLYHMLRAIKWGAHTCARAQELVLIADNASENKNNEMFAFCTELVMRGWFRNVTMLFGPVGHTHNGIDGYHFTHNQVVGNYCSVSLAEYIHRFNEGWHTDRTRPKSVLLETQYNWRANYAPDMQRVEAFSKSRNVSTPCRAFHFRLQERVVAMQVKVDPCQATYTGVGGVPDGPGFVVLRTIPRAVPQETAGVVKGFGRKYVRRLDASAQRQACETEAKLEHFEWVLKCAESGSVVGMGRIGSGPEDRGAWGHAERIGFSSCFVDIPVIRRTEYASDVDAFWKLPDGAKCMTDEAQLGMTAALASQPQIRYARSSKQPTTEEKKKPSQKRHKKQTADSSDEWEEEPARKRVAQRDDSSEADEEDDEDDNDEEDPHANESGDEEEKQETYGADFTQYRVGEYAVVTWRDEAVLPGHNRIRRGIQVVKITEVSTDEQKFVGSLLECTVAHNSPVCISSSWYIPKKKKDVQVETYPAFAAAVYFSQLNRSHAIPGPLRASLRQNVAFGE
jgi:hypothetical protein